jgi:hypothetical protein
MLCGEDWGEGDRVAAGSENEFLPTYATDSGLLYVAGTAVELPGFLAAGTTLLRASVVVGGR